MSDWNPNFLRIAAIVIAVGFVLAIGAHFFLKLVLQP